MEEVIKRLVFFFFWFGFSDSQMSTMTTRCVNFFLKSPLIILNSNIVKCFAGKRSLNNNVK